MNHVIAIRKPTGRFGTIPSLLGGTLVAFLSLFFLPLPGAAQDTGADLRGADVTGGVADRDNTRVHGTIFDSSGDPLTGVQIWVMNDKAPANRVRAKGRKTGSYLVRGLPRLYTRDDVYDIDLRVLFEKDGYQSVETVVHVQKDAVAQVYPIMLREGETDPRTSMSALLVGQVVDDKGKPVKSAKLRFSAVSEGGDLDIETTAEKDGTFEVLLWQAPQQVKVEVTSSQGNAEIVANLAASPNPLAILAQSLQLQVR
jgi:hypothetical protein